MAERKCLGRINVGPTRPGTWLNECGEIGEPEAKGARAASRFVWYDVYIRSSVSRSLTLRGTRNLLFTLKSRELCSRISI